MPKPGSRPVKAAQIFLGGTERAISQRQGSAMEYAAQLRAKHPDWSTERLAKYVTDRYLATVTIVGGGAGATAAIPAAGLVTGLAVTAVDMGVYGFATARMVLTVAALYGVDLREADLRRTHVLAILAGDEAAIAAAAEMATTAERFTVQSVSFLNNRLARNVTIRMGARVVSARAAALIPLGIGALTGGGANFLLGKSVADRAVRTFSQLATRGIEYDGRIITTTSTVSNPTRAQLAAFPPPTYPTAPYRGADGSPRR